MLLSTLAASLLGNMLASKPKTPRREAIKAGEGVIATSQGQGTTNTGQGF